MLTLGDAGPRAATHAAHMVLPTGQVRIRQTRIYRIDEIPTNWVSSGQLYICVRLPTYDAHVVVQASQASQTRPGRAPGQTRTTTSRQTHRIIPQ